GQDEISISNFAKWVTAYGSNRNFWPILLHDIYYCVGMVARSQFESLYHIIPAQIIIFRGLQTGENTSLTNLHSFVMALILMLMIERIHFINFRATDEQKALYRKVFLWMLPYFVFFGFFAPENYFYRIFYLAPLIIFGGGLIESSTLHDKKNIKPYAFVFVIFTFLYNGYDGIIPESKTKNNPFIVSAGKIHNAIGEDDLVIFADKERYLAACFRYYFDREALHALSRLRYKVENPEDIKNAKYETVKFLSEKYSGIYLTSTAREMGVNTYYFSLNNMIPPHPEIMLMEKDQLIQQDYLDYHSGVLFKVKLTEPNEGVISEDAVTQFRETIAPLLPIR
ncbi:hypothetical protein KKB99_04820, partial [bacterium]|nr:hypothetical protein [bacterium]MBU1025319.1 hypothetical protein [bacterium]